MVPTGTEGNKVHLNSAQTRYGRGIGRVSLLSISYIRREVRARARLLSSFKGTRMRCVVGKGSLPSTSHLLRERIVLVLSIILEEWEGPSKFLLASERWNARQGHQISGFVRENTDLI